MSRACSPDERAALMERRAADPDTVGRFWSRVDKTDSCWVWARCKTGAGYGQVSLNKVMVLAHRFSYVITHGALPRGLVIDHLCRTPACVRPDHIEAVTQKTNMRRGLLATQTRCKNGHPFSEANTYIRKNGQRKCRACNRYYMHKRTMGWRNANL